MIYQSSVRLANEFSRHTGFVIDLCVAGSSATGSSEALPRVVKLGLIVEFESMSGSLASNLSDARSCPERAADTTCRYEQSSPLAQEPFEKKRHGSAYNMLGDFSACVKLSDGGMNGVAPARKVDSPSFSGC